MNANTIRGHLPALLSPQDARHVGYILYCSLTPVHLVILNYILMPAPSDAGLKRSV